MTHEKQDTNALRDAVLSLLIAAERPLSRGDIAAGIELKINPKTLQRRLLELSKQGIIIKSGVGRGTKYQTAADPESIALSDEVNGLAAVSINEDIDNKEDMSPIFSARALEKLKYLEIPVFARKKVSYNFQLIQDYVPNETMYVSNQMREAMRKAGIRFDKKLAAGTYAKDILQKLLIDLSYNSSRLEGNTYSILDTQRLLEAGVEADDKHTEETTMILNHKEAIIFLVQSAAEIDLSSFIVKNIHAALSQDLINSNACGRVRGIEVNIGMSSYTPLDNSHQLEEQLEFVLRKARKIEDPFEQSFFLLINLSYLQAFEDVNKRTSRLSCNIPFIKENLCPLSFVDVPKQDYLSSLILYYETGEVLPAVEVFYWAYLKSCEKYSVVRESMTQIDPYRIKYRVQRKSAMGDIIRGGKTGGTIEAYLEDFCIQNSIEDPDRFIAMTITDLNNLHAGNLVGLGVTLSMFEKWQGISSSNSFES